MLAAGCAIETSPVDTDNVGNEALGIARFVLDDQADRTTVLGLDAAGNEVGRMTLVHGRFTLTGPFVEDYDTPDVDGRQLKVDVLGQEMIYETAGYEPVLELPRHPPSRASIAMFLHDPHVKAVLDRWQLGFSVGRTEDGEVAYFNQESFAGDSKWACVGQTTCGAAYFGTINTCGGGAATIHAQRVNQQPGTNCGIYTGPASAEVRLAQCCPAGSGGQSTKWYAQKVCPLTNTTSTSCGTRSAGAVCKGCPGYPKAYSSFCQVVSQSLSYCNSVPVETLLSQFE